MAVHCALGSSILLHHIIILCAVGRGCSHGRLWGPWCDFPSILLRLFPLILYWFYCFSTVSALLVHNVRCLTDAWLIFWSTLDLLLVYFWSTSDLLLIYFWSSSDLVLAHSCLEEPPWVSYCAPRRPARSSRLVYWRAGMERISRAHPAVSQRINRRLQHDDSVWWRHDCWGGAAWVQLHVPRAQLASISVSSDHLRETQYHLFHSHPSHRNLKFPGWI